MLYSLNTYQPNRNVPRPNTNLPTPNTKSFLLVRTQILHTVFLRVVLYRAGFGSSGDSLLDFGAAPGIVVEAPQGQALVLRRLMAKVSPRTRGVIPGVDAICSWLLYCVQQSRTRTSGFDTCFVPYEGDDDIQRPKLAQFYLPSNFWSGLAKIRDYFYT